MSGGVLKRYVGRVGRGLAQGTLLLSASASSVAAAWAVLFSCPLLGLLGGGLALSAGLGCAPRSWRWRTRLALVLLVLVAGVGGVSWRSTVREVDRSMAAMARKVAASAPLSLRDKLGLYGLNLAMGLAALPIYPEVARETLWLAVPSSSGRRVFRSRFAMRSSKIRDVVGAFVGRLRSVEGDRATLEPTRVAWPLAAYRPLGAAEARVALALNPARVSAEARREGRRWMVAVRVEVRVEYPQNATARLMEGPPLRVEEGLFWALQRARWLHPYTAVWEFEETTTADADGTPTR